MEDTIHSTSNSLFKHTTPRWRSLNPSSSSSWQLHFTPVSADNSDLIATSKPPKIEKMANSYCVFFSLKNNKMLFCTNDSHPFIMFIIRTMCIELLPKSVESFVNETKEVIFFFCSSRAIQSRVDSLQNLSRAGDSLTVRKCRAGA